MRTALIEVFGTPSALPDVQLDVEALTDAFVRGGRFAQTDLSEVASVELAHPEMRGWLQQLSDSLEPSDFHFAYRSYNEILMFVANAQQAPWFDGFERSAQAAFDAACLCKVLSKISGEEGGSRARCLRSLRGLSTQPRRVRRPPLQR